MATHADKSLIQKKSHHSKSKNNNLSVPALAIVAIVAVVAGLGLSGNPLNAANANVEKQAIVKGNAFKILKTLEDDVAMQDMMTLLNNDENYNKIRSSAKNALLVQGLVVNSKSEEMLLSLVVSQFILNADNLDLENKVEALAPISGSVLPKASLANWKATYTSYITALRNVHFDDQINKTLNAEKVAAATTIYSTAF